MLRVNKDSGLNLSAHLLLTYPVSVHSASGQDSQYSLNPQFSEFQGQLVDLEPYFMISVDSRLSACTSVRPWIIIYVMSHQSSLDLEDVHCMLHSIK